MWIIRRRFNCQLRHSFLEIRLLNHTRKRLKFWHHSRFHLGTRISRVISVTNSTGYSSLCQIFWGMKWLATSARHLWKGSSTWADVFEAAGRHTSQRFDLFAHGKCDIQNSEQRIDNNMSYVTVMHASLPLQRRQQQRHTHRPGHYGRRQCNHGTYPTTRNRYGDTYFLVCGFQRNNSDIIKKHYTVRSTRIYFKWIM